MFIHYIITAYRSIAKYKTQNFISVLGLSVTLLCFSICLYCTRYIYSTNECIENRTRIVQFATEKLGTSEVEIRGHSFSDMPNELKKYSIPEVEAYVYINYVEPRPFNIEISEEKVLPYTLEVMETDSAYQRVFTQKLLCGSWEQASHAINSILLSESTAKRIFGKAEAAVGKQMILTRRLMTSPDTTPLTGGISYTIQGVMEDLPKNNSLNFLKEVDAWVLNDSEGIINSPYRRSMMSGCTYALLKEGVSQEDFFRRLRERSLEYEAFREKERIVAFPFDTLFWKDSPASYFAIITLIAGILILLVGMLNFFHFLTGSFVTRIREYSLRKVSGARSIQLWMMLFVQSALLVLLAGLFTMMMMELTAPFLSINLSSFALTIVRKVLMCQAGGYLLGLLVCCMLVAALVVWKVKRITIRHGLFGGGGVYGKHRVRNVLLGIQLFICWIFVSLTTMLYLQSQKSADTIFSTLTQEEKEEIYSISLEEYTFLSLEERMDLIAALENVPGVKALLPSQGSYCGGVISTSVYTQPERNIEHHKETTVMYVDPSFFEFMNIPILAGTIPEDDYGMVVSKGFEDFMGKEMLGQTLYDWNQKRWTVIGICQPVIRSLGKMPDRYNQTICIYYQIQKERIYHCYVKCEPGQQKRVGEGLKKVLRERLPESIDVQMNTLMDDIKQRQSMEFELRGIVGFFSIVTIIIVLLGVYAAITLDTEYRRKEMAIRKVNGASVKDIAMIFAHLYIWLLVITAILAFPIIMLVIEAFSSQYAVFADTGIGFYASIFLGMSCIIALTVAFRIYLITKVNPAEIIRKE